MEAHWACWSRARGGKQTEQACSREESKRRKMYRVVEEGLQQRHPDSPSEPSGAHGIGPMAGVTADVTRSKQRRRALFSVCCLCLQLLCDCGRRVQLCFDLINFISLTSTTHTHTTMGIFKEFTQQCILDSGSTSLQLTRGEFH